MDNRVSLAGAHGFLFGFSLRFEVLPRSWFAKERPSLWTFTVPWFRLQPRWAPERAFRFMSI